MQRASIAPLLAVAGLVALSSSIAGCGSSSDTDSNVEEVARFTIPKSPSGMFYDKTTSLLHILCGTDTNAAHYLYVYTTDGEERCFITIPEAVGMTRVDGFYIVGTDAYIVDSQGPIYAETDGKLGGSLYQLDWTTHPCGCTSDGTCSSSTVEWTPTIKTNWAITATESTIGDGGGTDNDFRNSGIVVLGDYWFGINGVHPYEDSLTMSYPKSLIKVDMTTAVTKDAGFVSATQTWPFDGTTFGRDVDMEALTCGADDCASAIYIGDEYNWVYKLDLTQETPTKLGEWDCNSIIGELSRDDNGIESLTYDGTYFYIGVQETMTVYKLNLIETTSKKSKKSSMWFA